MIVKTKLAEIQDELAPHVEKVCMKGHGSASFLYAANNGRAVEISEDNGGFWLELWEKSDDEDAAPVKEMTVETGTDAVQNVIRWLRWVPLGGAPKVRKQESPGHSAAPPWVCGGEATVALKGQNKGGTGCFALAGLGREAIANPGRRCAALPLRSALG